jgi:hypothetical protein
MSAEVGEVAGRAGEPAPSGVARRVGPVVAVVGVLGALVALVWFAVAPDNVVGPVSEASVVVPASAVFDADAGDACIELVDGTGAAEQLCTDLDPGFLEPSLQGDLVVVLARNGPVVVDPDSGETTPLAEADERDRSGPGGLGREAMPVGSEVRVWQPSGEGAVLLDVGGPATRLDGAVLSPDGDWVVVSDGEGRVLVGRTDDPTTVYEWFRVDDGYWFDVYNGVRWEQ